MGKPVLRICSECDQTKLTPYASICQTCYMRLRYHRIKDRHREAFRQASLRYYDRKLRQRHISCFDCGLDLGEKLDRKSGRRWCDPCRVERRKASNRRKNLKRRGARVLGAYTLGAIAERDGWRCHLCGRRVDRRLPSTHRRGPTVDHLVPVVAGGQDEPANVALAHRDCNVRRRDRGTVQLRLVG